jgi:hypothetical protein
MDWTLLSSDDGPAARWKLRWALRGSWRRAMQYSEARQRADGRWEYCCRQDGQFVPVGYCAGSDPAAALSDQDGHTMPPYHRDGHLTRHDAEACYRQYQLHHALALDACSTAARRCDAPGCETMTGAVATLGPQRFSLCDDHRTREMVAKLAGDRAGACLGPDVPKPLREADNPEPPRDFLVPFPLLIGDGGNDPDG